MTLRRTLLLAVAVLSTGCQMFRAEVGMGAGLGATVKVPALVHTGLEVGDFQHAGWHYGRESQNEREAIATVVFWHWEGDLREPMQTHHACAALIPPLTTYSNDEADRDMWSLELGLSLFLFDLRLGFNPAAQPRPRSDRDAEKGPAAAAPSPAPRASAPPPGETHEYRDHLIAWLANPEPDIGTGHATSGENPRSVEVWYLRHEPGLRQGLFVGRSGSIELLEWQAPGTWANRVYADPAELERSRSDVAALWRQVRVEFHQGG